MNDIMPKVARLTVLALLGYAAGVARADGPWQITTLEDGYGFSSHTSIGELPGGYPIISYYDSVDGDLECAWFDGSVWHTTTVDSTGWVGEYNRLAVFPIDDPTRPGQPAIAYYDRTNGRLMYAERDPADPNVWHKVAVDQEANEDTWCSLAILPSGRPAISYGNDGSLKCAECVSGDCLDSADWCMAVVDTGGTVCNTDLAVFPADHPDPTLRGRPAISYHDNDAGILKFAWRQARNPNETPDVCDPNDTWHTTIVDQAGQTGDWTSLMVFPADHPTWPGQPAIAYRRATNEDLMYAWHEAGASLDTGWHPTLVDSVGTAGWGCSVAMLPPSRTSYSFDGTRADLALQPVISYIRDGGLRFAWLDKTGYWHDVWVASASGWQETSLAIPIEGPFANEPVVSYFNDSNVGFAWHEGYGWFAEAAVQHFKAGVFPALAVLPTGNAAIAYGEDYPDPALAFAWFDGNQWEKYTVDSNVNYAHWNCLATFPMGQLGICYEDYCALWFAWFDGTDWYKSFVDGWCSWSPALGVELTGPCAGQPAISYAGAEDLKYSVRDPNDLNSWYRTVVDSEANVGYYSALAFFPLDHTAYPAQPAISYTSSRPAEPLRFAWRDPNDAWQATTVDNVSDARNGTSLAFLPSGQPVISYHDHTAEKLMFAWHDGDDLATGWHSNPIGDLMYVGDWSNLAVLRSGQPVITFDSDGGWLRLAWHEGDDFTSGWHVGVIDSSGSFDINRVTMLPSSQCAVAYWDSAHWDLKYAQSLTGDLNCDGVVDFGDINPFVLALTSTPPDYTQYYDAFPNCPRHLADINGDGSVDFGDINPFVALFTGSP